MTDRNAVSDYMDMLLAGEPLPASASGSWDEPPPPPAPPPPSHNVGWYADRYLRTLLPRRVLNATDEGNRLLELGRVGPKEQFREMPGIGPIFVDAPDAAREGRGWAAAGNVAKGVLDLAGGAASKAPRAADAALRAWKLAEEARPAQVATQAEQELKRILLLNKVKNPKPGSAAQQNRIERANGLAERATPRPDIPASANGSPQVAQRQLDVASREWPGKVLAGTGVAAGASGIPGVVVDDIKGATFDPLNAVRKEQIEENRTEKQLRAAPQVEGSSPEVDSYWKQLDQLRHERNTHAGFAAGMGMAGGPAAYATMKGFPWAMRNVSGPLLGLGLNAATINPGLALPFIAAALAPAALPALGAWGTYELAKGTQGQIDQALQKHEKVKALAPVVRGLAENYRADQQSPPSLTPDQSY